MGQVSYWPWWLASAALGSITVGFWLAVRRPLGVSGVIGRLVNFDEERRAERLGAAVSDAELAAALERATREAFGDAVAASPAAAPPLPVPTPRPTLAMHALFLGGIVVGGFIGGRVAARDPAATLGPVFDSLVGSGWRAVATLVVGGALVGLGTTLCGGCASGHGLSGCSRLQPGSLLATATFFGSAVAASLLLAATGR